MDKKLSFKIDGMTCAVCSLTCEKTLKGLDGVSEVSVSLANKKAQLIYDDKKISLNEIEKAVREEGYIPVFDDKNEEYRKTRQLKILKVKLLISLVCAAAVLFLAMAPMLGVSLGIANDPRSYIFTQLALTLAVMAAGYKFYTAGFKNLFKAKPNMDSLVALGTSSAFLFSVYQSVQALVFGNLHAMHSLFYESAAVIIALIMLGKFLEMRTIGKAGEAVRKMLDMSPKQTIVLRDGIEETIPVSLVARGDILVAKPGDSIAVDGGITKGSSYIDESMLTGESAGPEKGIGQKVFAGTVNKSGLIYYRAEKIGKDTVLSGIISVVEEAQGSKAPISRIADRVAAVFVPVVLVIAVISFIIWTAVGKDVTFSLGIFVSVLVIACPCALGLATPAAIITGTGKGAQLGILFKNAESLENLSKARVMVFDKTGTLTAGKPVVSGIYAQNGFSKHEVLKYCAAAEKGSRHPIAGAIISEAKGRGMDIPEITDFLSAEGKGVQAVADGKIIKAGSAAYFENSGEIREKANEFLQDGKTITAISIDNVFAGIIAVTDELKPDSALSVERIKSCGIKTVMLTGDGKKAAEIIAKKANIDEYIAEVLPREKADKITELKKYGKVAMTGDGINDAPALVTADIGIAVGSGTDIAVESADIVLTGSSLKGAADAVDLSKKVMVNIRENLFWAFIYNIIGIPVAAGLLYPLWGVLLNPMIAALAMSFSSVSVVTNALRLNLYKSRFK